MTDDSFEWAGVSDLRAALERAVLAVGISIDTHSNIRTFKIKSVTGVVLDVYSLMKDVGPRDEVGILNFSSNSTSCEETVWFDFEKKNCFISAASKLIVNLDRLIVVEAGLKLRLNADVQITIVAGAFPYTITVCGLPGWHGKFTPEFPMERYQEIEI